ncbi:glycosyltransferase family 2 protein [Pontibacter oryzae]|uniref:Glycosyltransferase family 2 protein n=1 Tax=Pontibacter oryzae TaxID=2304593 RepID=A0A399SIA8_9BACT|nr:glycosyltransferase family 2 protein [Pontibacter oryzae]RIJ41455.1 glycosyltransferase family 2 protein [Pontibacter oryzae]
MRESNAPYTKEEKPQLDVIASIVAYCSDDDVINRAIQSFLDTTLQVHLYIIDNSPTSGLHKTLPPDERITYLHRPANLGYGAGHNVAIEKSVRASKYFLVLNPDVYFSPDVLPSLFLHLELNPRIGVAAPQVRYPNGSPQISRRLLPSPFDLIIRRLPIVKQALKAQVAAKQYEEVSVEEVLEVPFLLGCFLFIRSEALANCGGFDPRYFMYMEDLDLCRRISRLYQVVYYGEKYIYHVYERASAKHLSSLFHHIHSFVKYFNKWGWVSDPQRKAINKAAMRKTKTVALHQTTV